MTEPTALPLFILQYVFTKLTKVKYIMGYPRTVYVIHAGYRGKKLPWSKPAMVTQVETTQGHCSASLMTGQHVFRH